MSQVSAWIANLPLLARFAIILALVAIVPHAARLARVPNCVGFIVVGVILGPHLLGVVPRDEPSIDFFAELGKLLLMFFVGLEIDLREFSAQRRRAVLFGLLTFSLPLVAGTAAGFGFGYPAVAAILIGSLLASHTLIAYPIVSAAGHGARPAVTVTVGATVLTDMLSLLVLAACLSAHRAGFDPTALLIEIGQLVVFAVALIYGMGWVGKVVKRWLKHSQEALLAAMLVMLTIAATVAEAIDLEGIIGAFLAGLAINKAVRGSIAKDRLEFVGQAVFIPAFFVVTGFLVDLNVLVRTIVTDLPLVIAIVGGLILSKWAAAEMAGRAWGMSAEDRGLSASLTMPQVAATLAAALVGYEAVNAAGVRLLDERMLNTVLVLVVATSVLGPILTERYVRRLGAAADRRAAPAADKAEAGAG
jgi:Kef-type K+ transport system membrane component KefB